MQAVAPLRDAPGPVELSLTGGKDSRLIAAALARAGVPARARTYGFPGHPDVVIAAQVARELGLEHEVVEPRTTGAAGPGGTTGTDGANGADGAGVGGITGAARIAGAAGSRVVQEVDVLGRLRATVLVADGMLSAFENVGRPDPDAGSATVIGGHGGELLRGGYAKIIPGSAARRAAGSAELLRRPDHAPAPAAAGPRAGGVRGQPGPVGRGGGRCTRRPPWTISTWSTGPAAGRPRHGRPTRSARSWHSPSSTTGWYARPVPRRWPNASMTAWCAARSARCAPHCWTSRSPPTGGSALGLVRPGRHRAAAIFHRWPRLRPGPVRSAR